MCVYRPVQFCKLVGSHLTHNLNSRGILDLGRVILKEDDAHLSEDRILGNDTFPLDSKGADLCNLNQEGDDSDHFFNRLLNDSCCLLRDC